MDLSKRNAVVIGLGRSGVAAARLVLAKGGRVVAMDAASREKLSSAALELEGLGARLVLGEHDEKTFEGSDLAVISPGVPSFAALEAFERAGGEVIGELELGSRFVSAPIALVGGTNGKSTTTALLGAILEAAGKKVFVGGNFGTPLCEVVGRDFDVIVLEISSFQAERVPTLHAHAHALLNVTDDHLDRYSSFDAYANAKGNPFVSMTPNDVAILPHGDAICARQAARGAARAFTFSATDTAADIRIEGDRIVHRGARIEVRRSSLRLSGLHNLSNACAAIGVAAGFDIGATDAIERAFSTFEGLGHRTALVSEVGGVRYYDDSKGTNVGASVAALRGLSEPKAVLIAGGRDKLGAYEPLIEALRDRGRALVVIGEAADRIADAASGALPIFRAGSMPEAVRIARDLAHSGDAVLLSPACSSFDMFRDYKDRGDAFVSAVRELTREAS